MDSNGNKYNKDNKYNNYNIHADMNNSGQNYICNNSSNNRINPEGAGFFSKMCIPTIIYAVLYTFFLYDNLGGILMMLFSLTIVIYSLYSLKALDIKAKPMTIYYSTMMILTGLSSGLTDNKIIQTFNFLWICISVILMMLHNFIDDKNWGLIKYIAAAAQAVFGAIACIYEPFCDAADYAKSNDNGKNHRMLYVFIGVAIAFPILIVVTVLLCSADAVFADVIKKLFADINLFTVSTTIILFVFAALSAYCGIRYLNKKEISGENFRSPEFPAAIAITVAATISIVYVFFCVIQIVYLFGRQMQLPGGYTYAQYAREGFFQLLFVCVLNVVIVLIGRVLFKQNKILNAFLILITLCTYIMIASSTYRMALYVGEYGLTTTRFCVFWALGVIGLFMLGIIISVCNNKFNLFTYGIIVIGLSYLALAFAKPDYWVAKYNTTQMKETDYKYLMSLSTDAAPVLAEDDGFMENEGLVSMYARKLAIISKDSLRRFNASHIRAVSEFGDEVGEAKESQYVLLSVYTAGLSSDNEYDELAGVSKVQLGYRFLKDTDAKSDSSTFYDNESDDINSYDDAEPAQFTWMDVTEIENYSDSERIFLAKIPRKVIGDKKGINIEYSFAKSGETKYSDETNVILGKSGISELAMSYDEYAANYGSPEYQIYIK